MKTYCRFLYPALAAVCLPALVCLPAAAQEDPPPADATLAGSIVTPAAHPPLVFVIPIEGMIERGLLYVIRRGFAQAVRENATAIILDMNTPGGRVDVTEEIMRMLIDLPATITTYTYVNKDALSAGALITAATDRIYMAPGSRVGASAIVGPAGDIEDGDLKEKHVSALVALARSAAESKGHAPDLVEAMIRKDMLYQIGEEIIAREGQLLTLTDRDASRRVTVDGVERPLFALGTVDSLEALKGKEGLEHARVRTIILTRAEQVARYIELFSFIFLAGGLLGLYIEFKTPGFGLPGILGGILLAVFFLGHRIAGLSGDIELILFAVGLLLLLLEFLVIPGFGLAGISGITLILFSVFFSMVRHSPGTPWFKIPPLHIENAFQNLGLAFAMTLGVGLLVSRFLPKTKGFQQLVLNAALAGKAYDPSVAVLDILLPGSRGTALTALHPAGFASVNGRRLSVVARGAFIDPGEPVVIAEVHGNRIVVDPAQGEPLSGKAGPS